MIRQERRWGTEINNQWIQFSDSPYIKGRSLSFSGPRENSVIVAADGSCFNEVNSVEGFCFPWRVFAFRGGFWLLFDCFTELFSISEDNFSRPVSRRMFLRSVHDTVWALNLFWYWSGVATARAINRGVRHGNVFNFCSAGQPPSTCPRNPRHPRGFPSQSLYILWWNRTVNR